MVESMQTRVVTRWAWQPGGFCAGTRSGTVVCLGGVLSLALLGCGAGHRQPVVSQLVPSAASTNKDISQAQRPDDGIGADATTQSVRSHEAVSAEMMSLPMAIFAAIPKDADMSSATARRKSGEKALPLIRRMCDVIDEYSRLPSCSKTDRAVMKVQFEALLIVFGDTDFEAATRRLAAGEGETAINARLCLASAGLALADKAQAKAEVAAAAIIHIAERSPSSERASLLLMQLREDERLSKQTQETADHLLREVMISTVSGLAKQYPATQKIGG